MHSCLAFLSFPFFPLSFLPFLGLCVGLHGLAYTKASPVGLNDSGSFTLHLSFSFLLFPLLLSLLSLLYNLGVLQVQNCRMFLQRSQLCHVCFIHACHFLQFCLVTHIDKQNQMHMCIKTTTFTFLNTFTQWQLRSNLRVLATHVQQFSQICKFLFCVVFAIKTRRWDVTYWIKVIYSCDGKAEFSISLLQTSVSRDLS